MSEIQRRRRMTGFPLRVPEREDAALEAEANRLQQMEAASRNGMPQRTIQPGIPAQIQQGMAPRGLAAATQGLIPAESPVRTAEEEEAYNLGAKMGAESIAQMVRDPAAAAPRRASPSGMASRIRARARRNTRCRGAMR